MNVLTIGFVKRDKFWQILKHWTQIGFRRNIWAERAKLVRFQSVNLIIGAAHCLLDIHSGELTVIMLY